MTATTCGSSPCDAGAGDEIVIDRLSRPVPTAAALWVAVAGVAAYMFMPLMVGGLADERGFTSARLGLVCAAEAGGMGLANAVAVIWIRRWNWRYTLLSAASVMLLANIVSMGVEDFVSMMLVRLVDGLAGGTLIAVGVACQSDHRRANRVFGYFIALEMVVSSIGFMVLPSIREHFGLQGIFAAFACIAASGIAAAAIHPTGGASRAASGHGAGRRSTGVIVAGTALLGSLLFFMSQGGLWAFVERIGVANGLAPTKIGTALAVSSLFGIVGALCASHVARRVGLLAAFSVVLAGELICMAMLHGSLPGGRYTVAVCIFILVWSMALPLMLSQFNALDAAGRLVVLLYAMGKLGYTLGPALMGLLVAGDDFAPVLAASVAFCIGGMCLLMGLSVAASRESRGREAMTMGET